MATLLLLQGRRVITAEEIAGHFEVSLRTVYRDIAALSEGGVPIVAEAGVGYSLVNGYLMPPVMLTPEEAGALFMGGCLVERLTDRSVHSEMRSALLKIRSVLPRAHQDRLDRLQRSTELFIRGGDPAAATLVRIQSALAGRRVLRMEYDTGGAGELHGREVEPLGLVYYAAHWHLIGFCRWRNDYRDFRTDRIRSLRELGETFEGHAGFSLEAHLARCRAAEGTETVEVRVHSSVGDRFRRAWAGSIDAEEWEGEWIRIRFRAEPVEWLAGWLVGFGLQLEVLGPALLLTRVRQLVASLGERYGPS